MAVESPLAVVVVVYMQELYTNSLMRPHSLQEEQGEHMWSDTESGA